MIVSINNFLNEHRRFQIKCETLAGIVDLHVVAEAPVTYTGIDKPMHFKENINAFLKYPIHYLDLSDLPVLPKDANPWRREENQRMAILAELKRINPDIVIFGDADETPKPDVVEKFKSLNCEVANLEMDMLFYYFNRLHPDKWLFQRIAKWRGIDAPRGDFSLPIIQDAGWHFAYFGDKKTLLEKSHATSHAVETGGLSFIEQVKQDNKPNIDICSEYPFEKLPLTVQENKELYLDWFIKI
jgi:hypothetical protein